MEPVQSSPRTRAPSRSLTGQLGVSYDPKNDAYRASGWAHGKFIHLGRFPTIEEAAAAVDRWRASVGLPAAERNWP